MQENEIKVLNDREHVLQVPTRYIGSVKKNITEDYIFLNNQIKKEMIEFTDGFFTIFREPINNSIDEAIRTNFKYSTKIDININDTNIEIIDNGRGIPHKIESEFNLPLAVLAVTKLKAGGNFNDDSKTTGMHGEGVSLTNIFSKEFYLETVNDNVKTIVNCYDNMSEDKIKWSQEKVNSKSYTKLQFIPDFEKLNMTEISSFDYAIIKRMIIDLSICFPQITFSLNSEVIKISKFEQYCNFFVYDKKTTFKSFSFENLDIGILNGEYEQISFVNGLRTKNGGTHLNYISTMIFNEIKELCNKKYPSIKPSDIKQNLRLIVNLKNMNSPRFSSQTKDELSNSIIEIRDCIEDINFEFIAKECFNDKKLMYDIIESFKIKLEFKKKKELEKKEKKIRKQKNVSDLIDAVSTNRKNCILYIAEGESATSRFMPCRSDNMGAFAIRGRFPNIYGKHPNDLINNSEISTICSITNLKLSSPSILNLNWGKIAIMTDADPDGYAIGGTLIYFFYKFWPELIKNKMLVKAVSPLIIAKNLNTGETENFYSREDFIKKREIENFKVIKHNKGLGSLNKIYYKEMLNTLQPIEISSEEEAKQYLTLAFSKDSNKRKLWLSGKL